VSDVATVPAASCLLCGSPGELRYRGLRDSVAAAPGEWSFRRCPPCEILWLDPRPAPESLGLLYPPGYLTHTPPRNLFAPTPGFLGPLRFDTRRQLLRLAYGYPLPASSLAARVLARLLALWPGLRRRVGFGIRFVPAPAGRLLDVGCGNGEYLLTMSRLGWEVQGIEPDAVAAALARQAGLAVSNTPFESAPLLAESFAAITLHHVIEHLADPAETLQRLYRALRPGGVLVSISPNPAGVLARWFGSCWRQLDTPRHYTLMGPAALATLARRVGLLPVVWTSARMAQWTAEASLALRGVKPAWRGWLARWIAVLCAGWAVLDRSSGEEIILIARKPLL
jgi:2-polyprenyl-3-methyl-5-hydroxy-6-metoxy-1,4-benzoquinol methylase